MSETNKQPEVPFDDIEQAQFHDVLTRLDQAFADKTATVPEPVFVGLFLPFFAYGKNPKHDVKLEHWVMNVAKSATNSVDVVNQQGEVLFTVPPIFDASVVDPAKPDAEPFSHIVAEFRQRTEIMPQVGKAYLEQAFARRQFIKSLPEKVVANLRIWDAIFARYGYPVLLKEEGSAEEKKDIPKGSDDLEYTLL